MAKTKEKINTTKKEAEVVKDQLAELTKDELAQIFGGIKTTLCGGDCQGYRAENCAVSICFFGRK